jgi:hypothetical protein
MKQHWLVLAAALAVLPFLVAPPGVARKESEFRPLLLRPAFAKTVSKPMLPLLVDVLWLRALNAIGLPDTAEKNVALFEYGKALAELDPRFFQVYEYIGLAIPYAVARNTWVGAHESSEMFRLGLKAFPTSMKLHMYLGFELMHRERKFDEAADVFAAAARLPDAIDFMAPLAARLTAQVGKTDEGLEFTREMLAHATDETARRVLEQRVHELELERVLQAIDRAAQVYKERHGRWPWIDELRAEGLYTGPMTDEDGSTLEVDEQGRGKTTAQYRRLEIFE